MNGSVTIVTSGSRCVTIWPRDICAALFNATNSTIFTSPLIFLTSHCFFWTHSKTWWMVRNSTFKTRYKGLRFSKRKVMVFGNGFRCEPEVIFATCSKAHVANWKLLSRWLVDIFVSFLIRWFISQNNFGISSSFRRFFFKHTFIYTTSNCQTKFMRYFIFSQSTIWILIISLDPKSTI